MLLSFESFNSLYDVCYLEGQLVVYFSCKTKKKIPSISSNSKGEHFIETNLDCGQIEC